MTSDADDDVGNYDGDDDDGEGVDGTANVGRVSHVGNDNDGGDG